MSELILLSSLNRWAGHTLVAESVKKMVLRQYDWSCVCVYAFLVFTRSVTWLFMLVCEREHWVLTGGSGGGNAISHTLRIYFHVSHPPSRLIVILVASAFKLTYVNVFLGFSQPDLKPFYISSIDHCFATNNCSDNCYLLSASGKCRTYRWAEKKWRVCRERERGKSIERKQFSLSWEKFRENCHDAYLQSRESFKPSWDSWKAVIITGPGAKCAMYLSCSNLKWKHIDH